MSILSNLKLATAAPAQAAPAPAPAAPPPNAVSAPTVISFNGGGRMRMPMARVRPSTPDGRSPQYAEKPLMPSAATIPHGGQLMSPEQVQEQEMAQAAAQEETKKSEPKPAVQDTPVSDHLLGSWMQRVKRASDPGFYPTVKFPGGGAEVAPSLGLSGFERGYNPFADGSGMNKLYSVAKGMLTKRLTSARPENWMTNELRTKSHLPYVQALARNLAEPIAVGGGGNPLLTLGLNFLSSRLKGGGPVSVPSAEELEGLMR